VGGGEGGSQENRVLHKPDVLPYKPDVCVSAENNITLYYKTKNKRENLKGAEGIALHKPDV